MTPGFVWRLNTGAVKANDTSAAQKVYMTVRYRNNDEKVLDITSSCDIEYSKIDSTSGLHRLVVDYDLEVPSDGEQVIQFCVLVYDSSIFTAHRYMKVKMGQGKKGPGNLITFKLDVVE